jgi:hypothetical protein
MSNPAFDRDQPVIPRVPSTVTNMTTIMVAEHIYRRAYAR